VQLKALEMTTLRVLANENRALSQRKPNPASSVLKIRGHGAPAGDQRAAM
jgi:hypothetical protein